MYDKTPEIFHEPEEPNLHDMLQIIHAQTDQFENSASHFIKNGSIKAMGLVDSQIDALSDSIRNALLFVSDSVEYADTEKASLMASILIDDDKRRVEFLNMLCDPPEEKLFKTGYSEENLMATEINQVMDYYDSPDDAVQKIFEYHMVNMENDINHLSQTPIVIEKMATREQIEKIQETVLRIGETIIGTTVGIYLAACLFYKRRDR